MFIYDETYIWYIVIILAISLFAEFRIKLTFAKYSKIRCNMTGRDSANLVLCQNSVPGVRFYRVRGSLTDYFDPRSNSISLSDDVYDEDSIAAIGVGAHEAGHAVQYYKNYLPMKVRHSLVPIVNFGSSLAMPLFFLGVVSMYDFLMTLGIILFSTSVIFHMVTLPVESDASNRALEALEQSGRLSSEELDGARKVLMAARFTYIAAILSSLISLVRLIIISNRRKK